jgi:hypothetical protein
MCSICKFEIVIYPGTYFQNIKSLSSAVARRDAPVRAGKRGKPQILYILNIKRVSIRFMSDAEGCIRTYFVGIHFRSSLACRFGLLLAETLIRGLRGDRKGREIKTTRGSASDHSPCSSDLKATALLNWSWILTSRAWCSRPSDHELDRRDEPRLG